MQFKDKVCATQFEVAPPVLKAIALDMDDYCKENFGIELLITRVLDPVPGDSGVHEAGRAIDFRDEHPEGTFLFNEDQQIELDKYVNGKYERSDGKATLIFHSFCNGPLHLHLQIPQKWSEHNRIY